MNLTLVLASIGFTLLAAEAMLRWAGRDHPQWNQLDPLVGWRPRPGLAGWYAGEVDNYISINREGYRDARELETPDWTGDDAYPVKYPDGSGGEDDAHRRGR